MTGPPKEEKPEKKQKPAPKPARKRRRKGPVNVAKIPQGMRVILTFHFVVLFSYILFCIVFTMMFKYVLSALISRFLINQ